MLFAYGSDCDSIEKEYNQLQKLFIENEVNPTSGIVTMKCIPKIGFIIINFVNCLSKLQKLNSTNPPEILAYFVACGSSSCFDQRMIRQNR